MKRGLFVGLYAGMISGVAGVLAAYLVGELTGLWFNQLNWVSIAIASIIANIIGALIYAKWFQKTARPFLYYILLTAAVTLLLTLNDFANLPAEKFGTAAHPVHVVVALLFMGLVPKWMKLRKQAMLHDSLSTAQKELSSKSV